LCERTKENSTTIEKVFLEVYEETLYVVFDLRVSHQ